MYSDNFNAFTGKINDTSGITASIANSAAKVFDVSQREYKSIQFTAANIVSGNGAFGVEVSNDGVNWIVYNRLVSNVARTSSQTDTMTAAPTLSSNTSQIFFFNDIDYFKFVRVFCTITTDGTYYATLQSMGS